MICRASEISGTGGGGVAFVFDVFVTEWLSISSSSEVIDDELAGELEGGVFSRGLEEAIALEIGSLAFCGWETGASQSADI